ncbi:acyl-CoA dehydrogenase family protein [Nocardioides speluncae]|uniref:acyl-CoA dehydrogenase family protein n=1 Tax=Nocardioides speluncae TaxID=2670337 RepID=UPI000D68D894|nr:acyl-CoA dehydrogenase family protein [Nocardioides speluncae]
MDFEFTPEQDAAGELAATILAKGTTQERLREVEQGRDRFDHELWQSLADAGLVSLAIPEEFGGAGLGLLELCRVLVEAGRTVAPVPLATHGPSALLLAEHGSADQRELWLYGAATGERLVTAAVAEDSSHLPERPTVTAAANGDGWLLTGSKALVRAAAHADLFLVTASTADGVAVFLVEPGEPGVSIVPQHTTDGDTVGRLDLDGAAVGSAAMLGAADGTVATRLGQLLTVASAAEQLGITEGALRLTAAYAKQREQFGRPIATFQAVSQRLADGYIDVLAQRLTLWQAVWRLSEGLPAEAEVATAKLWAADAGHRIAHTAVHVHGGVGIDLDGTAHRYFTAAKRFDFAYGGATEQAIAVGRTLAAEPV